MPAGSRAPNSSAPDADLGSTHLRAVDTVRFPMTNAFILRHRQAIAYISLIAACYLAYSIFTTWFSLALFWINAWPKVVLLAIAIAIHVAVRKGAEIPRLAQATKVGVGCVVSLILFWVIIFLMAGPMG